MKISVLHAYSDSNKGDLAIVLATVKALKSNAPHVQIYLHSVYAASDPNFSFHHRHIAGHVDEVCSHSIPSPYIDDAAHSALRNVLAAARLLRDSGKHYLNLILGPTKFLRNRSNELIQQSDLVLLKGGQYIYSDQGGLRGVLYLWRVLSSIHQSAQQGKRVVIMGQSLGPLPDGLPGRMVAKALRKCELVVVRERLSLELAQRLMHGNTASKLVLAPDFAFLIEPREPANYSEKFAFLDDGDWIGVTVVNWYFPGSPDVAAARRNYETQIIEACVQLHRAHGFRVALFPQVTVRHHGESDLDLLKRISDALEARDVPVRTVVDDLAPEQLSYLYGRCRVLIGTRLHSCILAAVASCPVVAIRYQGFKTEGVMAELGMSEHVLDISHLEASDLTSKVTELAESRTDVKRKIDDRVAQMRKDLSDLVGDVLSEDAA
ncbi:polysaccharide pyruvyl transferase family protein [Ramlibacter algicola]|uniref:Polysaccharide pyruvyl transferase family protein n=1 Tax=Ramlibacter algicola TaxID=2795217 RepID=A0A934Q006_9BURK|nr:polysaccharide pyruvyl transferase family protein [Ramlibacter algicola]MBK0391971.1 polysaccharide pyruvyl transferase family protein [Ramlibacter algicola]